MDTGIYKITNIITGQIYIGSTTQGFNKRKNGHLCSLRKNSHSNSKLQHSFNKYLEGSFIFEIIERCDPILCLEREQYYIDSLSPYFNICSKAENRLGVKASEETKAKMRGRTVSEETRAKLGLANKGRKPTEETLRKRSDSLKGRVGPMLGKHHSEETKAKMRQKKISEERKAELSIEMLGNKRGIGNKNMLGHKHSEETKTKISLAKIGKTTWNKGIPMKEESKLKMIASKLKRREKNKDE